MEGVLLLEDGKSFKGRGFGARGISIGEVVFHTGMTGYQEILTDPSYKGQIVSMTCPHIGNYGINNEDSESSVPQIEGLVVKEACRLPSNYRSETDIDSYLAEYGIAGIEDIDTRALTRHIRRKGAMPGIISTNGTDISRLKKILNDHLPLDQKDLVSEVTTNKPIIWKEKVCPEWYYKKPHPPGDRVYKVAAFDFGIKRNILRIMTSLNMEVHVLPASTSAESVKETAPDGLFLSNGPGDPEKVFYAVETIRTLSDKFPIFGICLGHQILALSFKANTYKLKFGHHGSNHPVKDIKSGRIEITAQNHNFAVDADSLDKTGFEITHLNLNDSTVEGMAHKDLPIFSVQYHPEASPGPHDSVSLFSRFYKMMESN